MIYIKYSDKILIFAHLNANQVPIVCIYIFIYRNMTSFSHHNDSNDSLVCRRHFVIYLSLVIQDDFKLQWGNHYQKKLKLI